jgi:DNA-binding MarR family transcriptional regulator
MVATLGNTQGLRMHDLAQRMVTSPQNVTRVARALEARGLVERARSERSGREVICRLTAAGHRLFADLYPRAARFTIEVVDRSLSRREQTKLVELLERLANGVSVEKTP